MENNAKKEMLGYTPEQYKLFMKNAALVLGSFCVLYAFLYLGRVNISRALPIMEENMGWSSTQLGVLGSILFITYGCGHFVNGRLGEIFGVKKFIIGGAFLSIIANVLIGFSSNLAIIYVLWGLNGYFQSMLWSPGMALVSKWWPGGKRGFATGLANAFSSFGNTVTWLIVPLSFSMFPAMSWRAAFTFPMVFLAAAAIAFGLIAKSSPKDIGLEEYEEDDPARRAQEEELHRIVAEKGKFYPYVYLISNWRFVLWCVIVAGSNLARYGLISWIPKYFVEMLGMDPKKGIAVVLLPLGMAFGTFLVPWFTDKFMSNNRLPAVIVCSLVAAATVFLFPRLTSYGGIVALLFIAGFFIYAINGIVWAYATDIGGRAFAGTAAGILDAAAYGGAALQSIAFGILLDSGNWDALFVTIACVCLVSTVAALLAGIGLKKK